MSFKKAMLKVKTWLKGLPKNILYFMYYKKMIKMPGKVLRIDLTSESVRRRR